MATSATGISYNFANNSNFGKMANINSEVSQDLHLKMSKKIAQLTKVIYALNTKNDEHEAIVTAIKDQHEEEIQKILSDCRAKLESFRVKIEDDINKCKIIESLEKKIAQHDLEKAEMIKKFSDFKIEVESKAIEMKTIHSEKMLSLSTDVLHTKKNFETQLEQIQNIRYTIEEEKSKEINDLKEMYESQISDIKAGLLNNKSMEQQYKSKIKELEDERERLKIENQKQIEEFNTKLFQQKNFFDKELEAIKGSWNSNSDEKLKNLQSENDRLNEIYEKLKSETETTIQNLTNKLAIAEKEASDYQRQLFDFEHSLKDKNSSEASLSEQINKLQKDLSEEISIKKQLQVEITALNDRCDKQSKELIEKSRILGKLEALKLQNESQIKDYLGQLTKLKDKLNWLEEERKCLEQKGQSQISEKSKQLKSLEKSLDIISTEKQALQEKYDRDISALKKKINDNDASIEQKWKKKLDETEARHTSELDQHRQLAEESYAKLKSSLEEKLNNESQSLSSAKDMIEKQLLQAKEELTNKLQNAQREILRLENLLKERELNLGGATSDIESLQKKCNILETEMENLNANLISSKTNSMATKTELENLKRTHERFIKEAEERLKSELNKLSADLDSKWMDTLKSEKNKITDDLTKRLHEDKRSAMDELRRLNELNLANERKSLQDKIQSLIEENDRLIASLDSTTESTKGQLDRIRMEAEAEIIQLKKELLTSAEDYNKKIQILEEMHNQQLQNLENTSSTKLKNLEEDLKKKYLEDMQAQMTAHKSTVEMLKDVAEKEKESALESCRKKNNERINAMRLEMEQAQSLDIEQRERSHDKQMAAARLELDRAIEINQQKEAEWLMKESDYESDLSIKLVSINELQNAVQHLRDGTNAMAKELEAKSKEVINVRNEMIKTCKLREDEIHKENDKILQNLKSKQQDEINEMLEDFNTAQELLKEKINTLTILLEEAEEKYKNRESRDEDLEEILKLRNVVAEKDETMKKLIDDRKYYQLELVNRETNFNKVFNTAPNVGVMNPLINLKKNSGKNESRKNSRLDPLPNSAIIHSDNLSGRVPLPPPKKYIK